MSVTAYIRTRPNPKQGDFYITHIIPSRIRTSRRVRIHIKGDKMKYGLPYKGSKTAIAEQIVEMLPEGERLVDLFGGGGAITHCAILKDKYKRYLYNDYDKLTLDYFTRALKGDFNDKWVSREDFERLKNIDGVVRYLWSFGNNGRNYLWGKDIEPYKKALYDYAKANGVSRVRGEQLQKFLSLPSTKGLVKPKRLEILQRIESLGRLQSLERLGRLQRLQSLGGLQRLQSLGGLQSLERLDALKDILDITNISYEDYEYKREDIVYCDIPYENTDKYNIKFNHEKFYEWARTREYPIYFSSYQAPKDFYKLKVGDKRVTMCSENNSIRKEEYLFSNQPMNGITYQTSLLDFI